MTREELHEAVRIGAEMLDTHVPGWEARIDLEKLDLQDYFYCILGQTFGNYGVGLEELGLIDNYSKGRDSFTQFHLPMRERNWESLHEEWVDLIKARRNEPKISV